MLDFIDGLRPDLKNRFISSAVKIFSEDTVATCQSLRKISVEEIERFLDTVNKQGIAIPSALKSLIDKFSSNAEDASDAIYPEEESD